jgi:uracil-DNA glycosylase
VTGGGDREGRKTLSAADEANRSETEAVRIQSLLCCRKNEQKGRKISDRERERERRKCRSE